MKNKPLIRWTVGPVKKEGFRCLKKSVRSIKELYPECDLAICYNQLEKKQVDKISSLGVELFDQTEYLHTLKYPPNGKSVHWKLYPPRLRKESHEICLDNDIVLWKRVHEIDYFLNNDVCLMYQGEHALYGVYQDSVAPGMRINSGIYGLPPDFDFEKEIRDIQKLWTGKFDEQGLVATILHKKPYCMVPLTTVPICEHWMSLNDFSRNKLCCGVHFVGINYKDGPRHQAWLEAQDLAINLL